jgi:hypothetical protein
MAVALVRQKEAAEADECGQRHGDLTSSVHVSFPQHFPPMTLARDDRFRSLREAFVVGRITVGEKQEQNKNKIGLPTKFMRVVGASAAPLRGPDCFAPSLRRAGFFDALHRQSGAPPLDPELDVGVGVAPAIGG